MKKESGQEMCFGGHQEDKKETQTLAEIHIYKTASLLFRVCTEKSKGLWEMIADRTYTMMGG